MVEPHTASRYRAEYFDRPDSAQRQHLEFPERYLGVILLPSAVVALTGSLTYGITAFLGGAVWAARWSR